MFISFDQMRELIDSRMPVNNPFVPDVPTPVQVQPVPSQDQQDASRPHPHNEITDLGGDPDEPVQVEKDKITPHFLDFFRKLGQLVWRSLKFFGMSLLVARLGRRGRRIRSLLLLRLVLCRRAWSWLFARLGREGRRIRSLLLLRPVLCRRVRFNL